MRNKSVKLTNSYNGNVSEISTSCYNINCNCHTKMCLASSNARDTGLVQTRISYLVWRR